jgi:hypothetical protein
VTETDKKNTPGAVACNMDVDLGWPLDQTQHLADILWGLLAATLPENWTAEATDKCASVACAIIQVAEKARETLNAYTDQLMKMKEPTTPPSKARCREPATTGSGCLCT